MATYIVGDIQGCFDELKQLLDIVDFSPVEDELWLTGDLVSRGPKSLETLRYIKGLGNSAKVVLGNHDLHLIAIHHKIRANKRKDKLNELLNAPDGDELIDWLRHQPLLLRHPDFKFLMVHAGISPNWSIKKAEKLAKEVEAKLQSDNFTALLDGMYGNHPASWSDTLQGIGRYRYIINTFTRMRYCLEDGSLEFKHKLAPQTCEQSIKPWFELRPIDKNNTIIFGHWAALLGNVSTANILGLDTGCVWGNSLTMLRWQDKKYFSLACPIYCQ